MKTEEMMSNLYWDVTQTDLEEEMFKLEADLNWLLPGTKERRNKLLELGSVLATLEFIENLKVKIELVEYIRKTDEILEREEDNANQVLGRH